MTCIVAVEDKGTIYMGGDSAGVAGLSISIRADEKVFLNGPFIMGFTTSFRMGQLLRFKFVPPAQPAGVDDLRYMVTDFIDAVRKSFFDNGFGKKDHNEGGNFLVGYKGKLYHIGSDFQVGIPTNQHDAVGCGRDLALGALYATKLIKTMNPSKRVITALEAATAHSAGVAAPYVVLKSK